MARVEKTVFISYRRTDVYTALAVYQNLKDHGYNVFFDYRSISSGDFEQNIISNIKARAHFLIILTPTALDRCNERGDWLRREIETAIGEKRNIVPLFFKGFQFNTPSVAEKLTGKLENFSHYNGLNVHEDYFDEAMDRLRTEYLNKRLTTILHPISTDVQKVVREEQVAADQALEQIEDVKGLVKQPEEKQVPIETPKDESREKRIIEEFEHLDIQSPKSSQYFEPYSSDDIAEMYADVYSSRIKTSALFQELIIRQSREYLANGYSVDLLERGLQKAIELVDRELRRMSVMIDTKEALARVATNSVSDEKVGDLIADVLDKIGKDGAIDVENAKIPGYEIEYIEGLRFDGGYFSDDFITVAERKEAIVSDPYIIISNKKISLASDINVFLEKLLPSGKRELVIIAEDVTGEALANLVLSKQKGLWNVIAAKTPGPSEDSKVLLQDIAILTGATLISEDSGRGFASITLQDFGNAEKVISNRENTTIIGGKGKLSDIIDRIKEIRIEIGKSTNDYDREKLRERLARTSGGFAIIRVGAETETEMEEKKRHVADAFFAARAAIEGGILPGNGVAYLNCIETLDKFKADPDERIGISIIHNILDAPIRQIAIGAGLDANAVLKNISKLSKENGNKNIGYDQFAGKYVDMVKAGKIEPTNISIHSLVKAVDSAVAYLM